MTPNIVPSPGPNSVNDPDKPYVLSYIALRKLVGLLAFGLPLAMLSYSLFAHHPVLTSLSAYYYTPMREVFTGALCAIGVFLVAALGYEEDRKFSVTAGILAFGVAAFHCDPIVTIDGKCTGLLFATGKAANTAHAACAMALFCVLAYFCLVLFRKTKPSGAKTARKKTRNKVYLVCGLMMVCAELVGAADAIKTWGKDPAVHLLGTRTILWVELVCMVAFGFAWLTKGEALFPD